MAETLTAPAGDTLFDRPVEAPDVHWDAKSRVFRFRFYTHPGCYVEGVVPEALHAAFAQKFREAILASRATPEGASP